jgi:hypothetical protein
MRRSKMHDIICCKCSVTIGYDIRIEDVSHGLCERCSFIEHYMENKYNFLTYYFAKKKAGKIFDTANPNYYKILDEKVKEMYLTMQMAKECIISF